jgi:hypothetical protein
MMYEWEPSNWLRWARSAAAHACSTGLATGRDDDDDDDASFEAHDVLQSCDKVSPKQWH